MLRIDGSQGEGGGQILRSALALSMCLGKPFHISGIRATRAKPGLRPQHLAAVRAAALITAAELAGAEQGSKELSFAPGRCRGGDYHFAIGTAGSTTLLGQALLPALALAGEESVLDLEGGTHCPLAPSLEFLGSAYLPVLNRMGPRVTLAIERPGYLPAGGGRIRLHIHPVGHLQPFDLCERGRVMRVHARILLSHLPVHIAQREATVLHERLGLVEDDCQVVLDGTAVGPGNAVSVLVDAERVCEVFTALGRRGLPAEQVAARAAGDALEYLAGTAPVGRYLADQLLLPMALAGGGAFVTGELTSHCTTNMAVIQQFTGRPFRQEGMAEGCVRVSLAGR